VGQRTPGAGPLILRGERVVLRPVGADDLPAVRRVLADPEVAPWWPMPDEAGLRDLVDDEAGTRSFRIMVGDEVAGLIQCYEELDPDYRHAGMDIAVATAHHGHGYGREALQVVARYLIDVRGHHRLIIDPAAANERAIATYRRLGFRPVGVMRDYERGPDGTWHDGLLMDMLAGELVSADR